MTAVIIPAFNEAASIEATLHAVLAGNEGVDAEVIVVCNGCTDDTADRARRCAPHVRVVETPIGSKTHALNLGDDVASSYPRIYLDADIVVSKSLLGDLARVLDANRPLVAYPSVNYDLRSSSRAVRAFYEVWRSMPYNRPGRIGVGVFAMNRAGRERFGRFPDVISDDGFVRGQFSEDECRIVETCSTTVRAPATFRSLVKIKTRSRLGLYQLRRLHPDVLRRHGAAAPWRLPIGSTARLTGLPVYLLVNLVTRVRAANQRRSLERYRWERDESTRSELVMERA
ncbi:MAG: glycosyltransferase [Planctomycetaceae bacterium]